MAPRRASVLFASPPFFVVMAVLVVITNVSGIDPQVLSNYTGDLIVPHAITAPLESSQNVKEPVPLPTPSITADAKPKVNASTITATTLTPAKNTTAQSMNSKNNTTDEKKSSMAIRVSQPISADEGSSESVHPSTTTPKSTVTTSTEPTHIVITTPNPPPPQSVKNTLYSFYNVSVVENKINFTNYWENLKKNSLLTKDPILSNAYRNQTVLTLKFPFPFYGFPSSMVAITTEGFIHVGNDSFEWRSGTSYVAPLMADFNTSKSIESTVSYAHDDESLTVIWEKVMSQQADYGNFTFAAILRKNGNIEFVYKDIPVKLEAIKLNQNSTARAGISDGYIIITKGGMKIMHEYDKVPVTISNNTVITLTPMPTCVMFADCNSCINHNTTFECHWCDATGSCSSGKDRRQNDWINGGCKNRNITTDDRCDAHKSNTVIVPVFNPEEDTHVALVTVLTLIALAVGAIGWVLYAYRNPHTYSGQLLIKYRPTQWGWGRGEARYTAATIHM